MAVLGTKFFYLLGGHVFGSTVNPAHALEITVVQDDKFLVLGETDICLKSPAPAVKSMLESLKSVLVGFSSSAAMGQQTGAFARSRFILGIE